MAYFRTGGGTDTSDANAVAGDILLNKTAYVNDEKVTGTMPNNGAISGTIEAGETFTVPAGYTSGGTITASSAGATITVTYDSSFYNKTMTCTNGTKTYTKTTTSSGSTTFNVNEEGTWTINCNGVSRTVNVVLSYTTQMAITKTVTIYGAKEDYITYTDATGSKVCQFASGATSKSVSITFIPPSATITFISTVAKNPNNLSQNYSKAITITESTTAIYVMPDNVLYWWGYINGVQGVTTVNGWSSNQTLYEPQWNTNNIYCNTASGANKCLVGTTNKLSKNTLNYIINAPTEGPYVGVYGTSDTKFENIPNYIAHTEGIVKQQYTGVNNKYFCIGSYSTSTPIYVYAMWAE